MSYTTKNSLVKKIAIFKDVEADMDALAAAGEAFLLAVYGGSFEKDTLDSLRHQHFTNAACQI